MRSGSDQAVLWDFDGTLAERPGLWSTCLLEVLDEQMPGHAFARSDLAAGLRGRFPWNSPEVPHPELTEPAAWWRHMSSSMAAAYELLGFEPGVCAELAEQARRRFVDPSVGWRVFPDTVAALTRLAEAGWRHVVVSNHVPELPQLIDALGLAELLPVVLTSASIGYEKPHPQAFALALEAARHPSRVWMVGDNPRADVTGAEQAGIPAILVRNTSDAATRRADDVAAAADYILNAP